MSIKHVAKAISDLREATAEATWTQWSAIFTVATSRRQARSIVDPEALLLVSLALRDHEPRLWSAAVLWAQFGARLLSVQRAKNLARQFPPMVRERLGEFAQLAIRDGGDQRWRSLVCGTRVQRPSGRARTAAPRLEGAAALMLRLRLGLGVGIKPDVLTYLIGIAGGANPVILIARATGYQGRAVRRALEDLLAGGFVESRPGTPVAYRVDTTKWAGLLDFEPSQPPAWHGWGPLFAFIVSLDLWSGSMPDVPSVLASEGRDLMARHVRAFHGVPRLPTLDKYRGEAWIGPFVKTLETCIEYLRLAV
ncbi:MAG: hypothetical protein ACRDHY_03400 [Anaerolineales bacterium]